MARARTKIEDMRAWSKGLDWNEFVRRGYNLGRLSQAQIDEMYEQMSLGWTIIQAYENVASSRQLKKSTATTDITDEELDEYEFDDED